MTGINKNLAAIILSEISIALNFEAAALLLEEEEQTTTKKPRKPKPVTTKKKRRLHWVKPYREGRDHGGNIQQLLKEYNLYDYSKSYESYLRIDEKCFMEILNYVKEDIGRSDTKMRKCVPADQKLAATLRFLARGESINELAEETKLSMSYLCSALMEVVTAIYQNMGPKYLLFPDSAEKWQEVANEFERQWQFPMCLGALDGKPIAFKPKKIRANLFYKYKRFPNIVLLALADAYGKFLCIDICYNGRNPDDRSLKRSDLMSSALDSSDLMNNLLSDQFHPTEKVIGNNRVLPYVFVADNAFPLGKHLLTPYKKSHSAKKNIEFNNRLSRARQGIERAFGTLSNRFRILQNHIQLGEEKTKVIVQACCVLHNFLAEKSSWYMHDIDGDMKNIQNNSTCNVSNKKAEEIRNEFTQYFCNEGKC